MLMNSIQMGIVRVKKKSNQIPRFLDLNRYVTSGIINGDGENREKRKFGRKVKLGRQTVTNVVFNAFHLQYLLDNGLFGQTVHSAFCFLVHQPQIAHSVTFCFCSALNFSIEYIYFQKYVTFPLLLLFI